MSAHSRDFTTLIARLHKRARRLSPCPDDAADLAQEAALRLFQRQQQGQRIDNPEAYAMTALANLARSAWRARHPSEEYRDHMARILPDAPRRIAVAQVQRVMGELPADQRVLMALVAAGETSPAALARITGLPEGTVMSRLARARSSLRRAMGMTKSSPSATLLDG